LERLRILVTAGLLTLGVAGLAGAAPLHWAGEMTMSLGDFGEFYACPGGVATVNDSSGGIPAHLSTLHLAASRQGPRSTSMTIVTDPGTEGNGIAAVIVEVELGTGTFASISGGAASTSPGGGVMPVGGIVKTACPAPARRASASAG
jgi:hypothetical protein